MSLEVIFETERLLVRKLIMSDIDPFHKMQSNPNVMQYVTGDVKTYEEHTEELKDLIRKYAIEDNDFWIYAITKKEDNTFIGTCALIKDEQNDDEIGYRFLESYWGLGYGYEICQGIVDYSKRVSIHKLVGYVVDVNTASSKILERCGFQIVEKGIEPNLKLPETKYELVL